MRILNFIDIIKGFALLFGNVLHSFFHFVLEAFLEHFFTYHVVTDKKKKKKKNNTKQNKTNTKTKTKQTQKQKQTNKTYVPDSLHQNRTLYKYLSKVKPSLYKNA